MNGFLLRVASVILLFALSQLFDITTKVSMLIQMRSLSITKLHWQETLSFFLFFVCFPDNHEKRGLAAMGLLGPNTYMQATNSKVCYVAIL